MTNPQRPHTDCEPRPTHNSRPLTCPFPNHPKKTAAMIDRVVHHADVLTLKGASYRLRNRGIDTLPSVRTQDTAD
ncbi:MAG: ATP-binding protein [Dermatophilaceae bacterium]